MNALITTNTSVVTLPDHARSHATGPSDPPVRDMTLGDLLGWAATTTPDRVALIAAATPQTTGAARPQWTYAELHQQSLQTARALAQRFKPGERVAVWAPNIPQWVLLEFGVAMAGLVLVTVNPGFKAAEVEYVLKQSGAAGIFVVDSFRGNPMRATVDAVKPNCPALREVINFADWDAFIASGNANTPLPKVKSGDPVMIQYTSGTTGFPKGAYLHHRGLVNNAAHTLAQMGLGDGDVYLGVMPLFHTAGSVLAVLGSVARRATHVLLEAFEPGLVLELIATYRSNAMVGVPTMLIAMMEHPSFGSADLSSVRAICSGGSTVPAHLVKALEEKLGAQFTIVFGMTECSPVALMTHTTDTLADKADTLGTPMPNVEVKIVDTISGDTTPIGEVGEICTRGYHVMLGYFEMPEATAAAIDKDGWLHTGDLGAMDARGYFTIEGRLKDMIIRGGENIYPRELEELLFKHPAVGEVAVIGLPNDKWGEEVAAVIRPKPGVALDKDDLFAFVRSHLAPHKVPRQWFTLDVFPLTGSGKIQKFKLREMCAKGELALL
jgi:fatty-acyl-CoA synthase